MVKVDETIRIPNINRPQQTPNPEGCGKRNQVNENLRWPLKGPFLAKSVITYKTALVPNLRN